LETNQLIGISAMFKSGRPKIWNRPGGQNNSNQGSGGRKGSEGPPDIDQILRQLFNKIKGLFFGKSTNSGSSGMGGQEIQSLVVIVMTVLVFLSLISGVYIVDPPERAVVMRFGKYIRTEEPGPHWLLPFIESKEIVNVEQVATKDHSGLMLTRDGNIVSVGIAVQYRVGSDDEDVHAFLFNVVNPIRSLNQSAESALRQVVGQSTMDEVLTQKRSEIATAIKEQIIETLNTYNTGIRVSDVVMQFAKAPDEVRAAFDEVIKASADEERLVNQARAYENEVIPRAKGNAERLRNEAMGYKQETILLAEGNVQRFNLVLPQYLKAPQVTQTRLYLDTIEEILSKTSKIIVDSGAGNNLINLPLEGFMTAPQTTESSGNLSSSTSSHSSSTLLKEPLAAAAQYQQKEKNP
jgi:membrane protease subunit HflK